ncbi:Acyl-CoA-binding protein [Luteibacter sp. UNC138MFCol5.1]|nr:Acyl-CoA-binding protein [Luteibacter sp. UNC138MFCol5.1]
MDSLRGPCYKPGTFPCAGGDRRMSDELQRRFEAAAHAVMGLEDRPDNDTLLRLYALYKQGSEGDVHGGKPGFFDFVGTAKYEAWGKLKGTTREQAMRDYVALVESLRA